MAWGKPSHVGVDLDMYSISPLAKHPGRIVEAEDEGSEVQVELT